MKTTVEYYLFVKDDTTIKLGNHQLPDEVKDELIKCYKAAGYKAVKVDEEWDTDSNIVGVIHHVLA